MKKKPKIKQFETKLKIRIMALKSELDRANKKVSKLEKRTETNMKTINSFMEHYKKETGNDIPESVFLSFFNA